jgi:hypothetical protein
MPLDSCKNRRFEGSFRVYHRDEKVRVLGTTLAVTSNGSTLRRNGNWTRKEAREWNKDRRSEEEEGVVMLT